MRPAKGRTRPDIERLRASMPYGDAGAGRPSLTPEPVMAILPSSVVFLAGVWLVIAPFALDYRATGEGFNGRWNDTVIGVAIALLALVRMIVPLISAQLSLINVVLGGWLIAAPFVLGYNDGTDSPRATWNDILVGLLVIVLAMVSWRISRRMLSADQSE
ncbi:SPW repeat protein [Micromonospora sp. CPCC 206061]|uniref:SPW repeat protein n=1 Tax=Micromonospora sp. CPCC 206061 TaxID=3122410 RepID=UPI002FF0914D